MNSALCSECGHPLSWGHRCSIDTPARRRISLDLSSGARMDASLEGDASDETLAALRGLGEAVVARMKAEDDG